MGRGAPCQPIGGSGEGLSVELVSPNIGLVGRPPVPGSAILGGVTTRPSTEVIPHRATVNFNILGFIPKDKIVNDIYVEETLGFELPVARITLNNLDNRVSSILVAKEQSAFKVAFGYDNPGMAAHGTYIVQRPKFKFSGSQSAMRVEVLGYGEMVKMAATERRQSYKKLRDSDIARIIAGRNGFASDIAATTNIHDQVLQANESDYKFLAKRAKLYGFLLYCEDGVMHFHPPRPRESGITLTYLQSTEVNIQEFVVQSRTFMRGLQLKMTQIDPVTKEEISIGSTETPDGVQDVTDYQNWKELVSIPGIGQPQRFVTEEGHEQTRPLLQNQVIKMAQASRYVISASGVSFGLEGLRASDLITINGIGRSSGRYFVTRAIHHISAQGGADGGFKTRFEVVRAGAGKLASIGSTGTPVELQREGTVEL